MITSFVRIYLSWWSKIKSGITVFNVKYLIEVSVCQKFEIYHKSAKTSHIPKLAALDNLVGSSSVFCTCVPYVFMVHLHKCLEIIPTGANPLTMLFLFFYLNTTNQKYIYINFKFGSRTRERDKL